MRIIECEQRSPEWFAERLGIPTASAFGKIVTRGGKERTGATPDGYLLALLGERLTRTPDRKMVSYAMDRGRELEPLARAWYAEHTGRIVQEVGFILHDSALFGCSPDGIGESVGGSNARGLEIKCPMLPKFMEYATTRDIPDDYWIQMQGSMLVTGLSSWDFVVFTDVRGLKPILTTVPAAPNFQEKLAIALKGFSCRIEAWEMEMRAAGNGVPLDTPIDLSALEIEPTEQEIADMDELNVRDI